MGKQHAARPRTEATRSIVPVERVDRAILVVRGHKVILDSDLADLYGVAAFRLNEAVKRNLNRFPADFMFRLTPTEHKSLISQFAMSKPGRGGRRSPPYAFTEQGVAMLSSVLHSDRAVAVNIEIMRAFVRLRQLLSSNDGLRRRLAKLERTMLDHDEKFAVVFDAIRQLMDEPAQKRKPPVGYHTEAERKR